MSSRSYVPTYSTDGTDSNHSLSSNAKNIIRNFILLGSFLLISIGLLGVACYISITLFISEILILLGLFIIFVLLSIEFSMVCVHSDTESIEA